MTYHMTWPHDIPHHMMLDEHIQPYDAPIICDIKDHLKDDRCLWDQHMCLVFMLFLPCILLLLFCLFNQCVFFYCSGCIQRQFSSQTRAFTTTLLYGLLLTMCNGGPHQQVNDHATLRNYSQKADYSL